jgi:hypothetical protein
MPATGPGMGRPNAMTAASPRSWQRRRRVSQESMEEDLRADDGVLLWMPQMRIA